jgi:hypothetical protein
MKRFRPILSSLMSLLLILSIFPPYAAQAASGGTGASDIPSGTVMIMNKWKSNYLYEASDGTVRYGLTNPQDESAHWTVDTSDGLSRIKNIKTGNYITIAATPQRHQALTTKASGDSTSEQWIIDHSSRAGYMIIRSATVPVANLVIHEEDQLGFAEASSDINITFESPQWAFVSINEPQPESQPVQIQSKQRPTHVIYEENGLLKHGVKKSDDRSSQWYIENDENEDYIVIRNRETGHLITQNETDWAGIFAKDVDEENPNLSRWKQTSAALPGYVLFENVEMPGHWINPQYPDDNNVRSNSWANPTEGNENAFWRIVLTRCLLFVLQHTQMRKFQQNFYMKITEL